MSWDASDQASTANVTGGEEGAYAAIMTEDFYYPAGPNCDDIITWTTASPRTCATAVATASPTSSPRSRRTSADRSRRACAR